MIDIVPPLKLNNLKKAVLIRGPLLFPRKNYSSVSAIPDIGLAYIHACFNTLGIETKIIDAPGEALDQIYPLEMTNWLAQGLKLDDIFLRISSDVDVIGISCMHSHRWLIDAKIIEGLFSRFPRSKIILGGEHATACFAEILKQFPRITAIVLGEGEETVTQLLTALDQNIALHSIQGISFLDSDEQLVVTPKRDRMENWGRTLEPFWKGVPLSNYLDKNIGVNSFFKRSLPILSSRGCPFSCYFCTCANMWQSRWIGRDVFSLINEMKKFRDLYRVEHFDFIDLTLGLNKQFIHEFAQQMIKEKLGVTWALPIGTREESLDEDLIPLLKETGLQRVLFSPETGSEQVIKNINKNLNLESFYKKIKVVLKNKIVVKVTFVMGFPEQKKMDLFKNFISISKLAYLGVHDVVCLSFVPYPGTIFYERLGPVLDFNDPHNTIRLNSDFQAALSWSEHISHRLLRFSIPSLMIYFYMLQFLIRPFRLWSILKRLISQRPLTNFESLLYRTFQIRE